MYFYFFALVSIILYIVGEINSVSFQEESHMKSIKISCAIIVKNGAQTIDRCLSSIMDSVDEIIIVDTGSTDDTIEIAKQYTSHIHYFEWVNDFSAARNYSLSLCTGDWILVVDADEYVDCAIREKLIQFVSQHPDSVGKIAQLNTTITPEGPQNSQCTLTRFFPKGLFFVGRVHEQVNTDKSRIFTEISVMHDGYLENNKVDRNRVLLELEHEDHPDNGYTLYQLGQQYFIEKDYANAIHYYLKSLNYLDVNEVAFPYLICNYIFSTMKLKLWTEGINLIETHYDTMCHLADFHFTCASFFMDAAFDQPETYAHLMALIPDCYELCLSIGEDESIDRIIGTGSFLAAYNLAAYYEAVGNFNTATEYYQLSAQQGYTPAIERLNR